MKILQISTADIAGGAESVAFSLFNGYRSLGHNSWLIVGQKNTDDRDVLILPRKSVIPSFISKKILKFRGSNGAKRIIENLSDPRYLLQQRRGHENFNFPGSWRILDLTPGKPDIVHCHNLHGLFLSLGGYFDLRMLKWLSRQKPVILTMHDAWLLSGHCAHSFECDRWKTGCGQCPDLTIYPSIRRDATALNWQRKHEIYKESRLYISTPSNWLMQKVEQSMIVPSIVESRVIPNGVDLNIFHPTNKQVVREKLGLSQDAKILLFSANGIRRNIWKDFRTLRSAIALIANRLPDSKIVFIALGEKAPREQIGQAEVRFISFQAEKDQVANYYQAADIYIHAALADTFPNSILEALACGTPVVATAVGGITEQVKGLSFGDHSGLESFEASEATGILVPEKDDKLMAMGIENLLKNELLRNQLSVNAAKDARLRFGLERQVNNYLDWFVEILDQKKVSAWNRIFE